MNSNSSISYSTETINTPDDILARLKVDKDEGGGKYTAFCPCHDDQNHPNLKITIKQDVVVMKCFTCQANGKDVMEAIGVEPKYLFTKNMGTTSRSKRNPPKNSKNELTVEKIAKHKNLPVQLIKKLGVKKQGNILLIPYKDQNGQLIRNRKRAALSGTEGSSWAGKGEIRIYGLWLLERMAKEHEYITLVEGETDCWTLWHHKEPALGVPGSSMTGKLQAEDIEPFNEVYCWKEPDQGGQDFIKGIRKRLEELNYNGRLYVIDGEKTGVKDPSDLHKKGPEKFKDKWNELLGGATETRSGEEWPDPIPFSSVDAEPLSADILPDWVKDYVLSLAEFTQTPVDMGVLLSLAAIATSVAGKAEVEIRPGYTEPLCLWTVTVLEPANRKSAVFKGIMDPIQTYETRLTEETEPERREAEAKRELAEDNVKRIRDLVRKGKATEREYIDAKNELAELEVPTIPRLIVSDITTETVAKLMAENNGRIASLSPEGDIFKVMGGRYSQQGQTNFENYKKGWTGNEAIRVDRMGREGSYIQNPAITMGLTVQPSVIQDLTHKEAFIGEGLLGRFLYAIPESPVGNRKTGDDVPALDQKARELYNRGLQVLLNTEPAGETEQGDWEPWTMILSREALQVRDQFEFDIEKELGDGGELASLKDWGGKLVGNITRVAVLLHIADHAEADTGRQFNGWTKPVTGEAMSRAVELGWKLIPHAKAVYDLLDADPEVALARYVLRRIMTSETLESLTVRDVHQLTKNKKELQTVNDLEGPLGLLEEHEFLRVEDRPSTGGRPPSPWVKINPQVLQEALNKNKSPKSITRRIKRDTSETYESIESHSNNLKNEEEDLDLLGGDLG